MDGELVNGQPSDTDPDQRRGRADPAPAAPAKQSEVFWREFPYYLSIGMTAEQYWDGDALLPRYYRKADRLRQERANTEAWLQGAYVYDAILGAAPVLHAFAKKGTKPRPYREEPFPLGEKAEGEAAAKPDKPGVPAGLAYMQTFMASFNRRFASRTPQRGDSASLAREARQVACASPLDSLRRKK